MLERDAARHGAQDRVVAGRGTTEHALRVEVLGPELSSAALCSG